MSAEQNSIVFADATLHSLFARDSGIFTSLQQAIDELNRIKKGISKIVPTKISIVSWKVDRIVHMEEI